jgi:methyl acetate hydrolase
MKIFSIFIYCLLFTSLFVNGQNGSKSFPPQKQVTILMDDAMKKSDLPAVVAIAINNKNERLIYNYGNAVWNENSKVTPQHIFRIWSMTKLVTSMAAMQLVEKGLIGLDDDLSTWLPEMAKIPILTNGQLIQPKKPITLRHLLTHTSGFGYGGTDRELANFHDSTWEYKDSPRRFESGTQFLYGSSTNWVGKLVEKVSGMDLETYFRKNITGPLGMNRTWFNLPDSLKQYIVSKGARGGDGKQPLTELPDRLPISEVTDFRGDGGLFSTPEDYTLLLKCLLNYGTLNNTIILKKKTVLEMTKNQIGTISMKDAGAYFDPGFCCNFTGITSSTTKWGLAWLIQTEDSPYGPKSGTVLWGGAFNTFFYIDFKSGVAASIFTQHVPFNHPETINLFNKFSEIIYSVH